MKKILYILLTLSFFVGCYEDKSSDRYEPIGSITISNIGEEYSMVAYRDTLKISPKITSTDSKDDPMKFNYTWVVYPSSTSSSSEPLPPDTLAQGIGVIQLDYDVVLSADNYTVQLQVTNPENGYVVYATTKLVVNTQFSTGHYFLKETADGNTELDFWSPDGDLAENLLKMQTGAAIVGSPTRLGYFTTYSYMDDDSGEFVSCKALIPTGGNDLRIMRVDNMSMIYDHKTMFYGDEPNEKPIMCFNDLFSRPMYVSNIGLYSSNQMPDMGTYGTGKYGLALEPSGGSSFSPHSVVSTGYSTTMFNFFDEKNGRLVYYNYNGALQTMSSDNGFSPTGINQTLLFMGTNGWAVFKDKSGNDRYLYKLNLNSARNPITSITSIDASLNFAKAQVYGSNKSGATGMLYAGVGDKLYMYNTAFNQESDPTGTPETLLSPREMGSGEEITMITHKISAPGTYLMIGTYKNGRYKVYMYALSGGAPSGDPVMIASGEGKVVDIQYASNSLGWTYNVNY